MIFPKQKSFPKKKKFLHRIAEVISNSSRVGRPPNSDENTYFGPFKVFTSPPLGPLSTPFGAPYYPPLGPLLPPRTAQHASMGTALTSQFQLGASTPWRSPPRRQHGQPPPQQPHQPPSGRWRCGVGNSFFFFFFIFQRVDNVDGR